jgi:hypothetical protein
VILLVICRVPGLLIAGGKAIDEKGVHAGDFRILQYFVAEMIKVDQGLGWTGLESLFSKIGQKLYPESCFAYWVGTVEAGENAQPRDTWEPRSVKVTPSFFILLFSN